MRALESAKRLFAKIWNMLAHNSICGIRWQIASDSSHFMSCLLLRKEDSMVAPDARSEMVIHAYKHSGKLHRVWNNTTILKRTEKTLIGANDKTLVTESDGRTWITREPAICYFHTEHWFNVIGMLRDDGIYYYCNISSPFILERSVLKYIDYDLDLKIYPDMTFDLLDEDEYEEHKRLMNYPAKLDMILYDQIEVLKSWVLQRKGPFAPGFVDQWYERFLTYLW